LEKSEIKSVFESMLFIWGEPLPAKAAAQVTGLSEKEAARIFEELRDEYAAQQRGIQIRRINRSYQFVTKPENAEAIRQLCTPVRVRRLSQAALEVLAIIAYKQPVTKGQIDGIRGVRCDRVVDGLLKKGLVRERGRAETVGRPVLYGTTDRFLEQFGFESLQDLPEIGDVAEILDPGAGFDEDSRTLSEEERSEQELAAIVRGSHM
jgi:segregation and condensation protein B